MMLGGVGAMLGGYLSDKFPVMGFNLPSGIPFAYIHLLTIITTVGVFLAICFVPLIPLHGQRTLRELLPIVFDWRFVPNIIRAQFLAYTSSPSVMIWAIKGLRGRSAEIALKEIMDKTTDADRDVRYTAIDAVRKLDLQQSRERIDQICADYDSGIGQDALVAAGKDHKDLQQVLDAFGKINSEAVRKEIAVSLADAFGDDNRFYKILTRETVVPGSYFMKLTNGIRKTGRLVSLLKETIVECTMSLEEEFHSGNCDEVLKTCRALIKQVDQLNGSGSSTTAMILDQLYAVAQARTDKAHATLEMLLGVYLTLCHIKKIAGRKSISARNAIEIDSQSKEQSVVPSK
jgi:hypothetical protein